MRKNKKVLQFKKIKIANINFIKGGGDEGHEASVVTVCLSNDPKIDCGGTRYEVSDVQNPCSDTCITDIPDLQTIFMSERC